MATPSMHKMAFPIETEIAYKFWASRHLCNRVKAIIAFSRDVEDANLNLRRFGYPYHFRARAVNAWQNFVNMPDMDKVPFTPMGVHWWDCMPHTPTPPPNGKWAVWLDNTNWLDDERWVEWIPDVPLKENDNDDTTGNDSKEASDTDSNISDK